MRTEGSAMRRASVAVTASAADGKASIRGSPALSGSAAPPSRLTRKVTVPAGTMEAEGAGRGAGGAWDMPRESARQIVQVGDVLGRPSCECLGVETLEGLLGAWQKAEARADSAALEPLLADDFRGDGPLGFVLDKTGWLDRYRCGELAVESFVWTAREVRVVSRTAVAIGTQRQVARYRGE